MTITIDIDKSTLKEIENVYGNSKRYTVESAAYNIFHRYFNQEYFDPELSIEKYESNDIEYFVLNEIKNAFENIFTENGYDKSLFDKKQLNVAINKESLVISEYYIGRIYTLAEIYHKLTGKINPYGKLTELVVGYDIK